MKVPNQETPDNERGAILIAILALAAVGTVFMGSMMSAIRINTTSQRESVDQIRASYLAHAALNQGYVEVVSQEDLDGDGLGAIGVDSPATLLNALGEAVGEYVCFVETANERNVLIGLAAIPSFQDAQFVSSSRAVIQAEVEFLLKPSAGAMAIAGPLRNPNLTYVSENGFSITGNGDVPAIVLSDEDAHENLVDEFVDEFDAGHWSGSELTGMTETYAHPTAGDVDWPVGYREQSFLSSDDLNEYRNNLRDHFLTLADSADRSIVSKVYGDQTWGTEANPEVTHIDCDAVGSSRVFRTRDQTITGHGTLVIEHTIRPKYNLNLDWTGDVVVIGHDGDGSDLLYLYGANANIDGNLILLSSDNTEASLEVADSERDGSYLTSSSQERPSNLTVNGSLLCLAEARSHESELEVEDSSTVTVNGLVGLYGSRIEIEASGSNTTLNINGTFAVGLPPDNTRTDDFTLKMKGRVDFTYDKETVRTAVEGLTELQAEIDLDGSTDEVLYNRFQFTAVIASMPGSGTEDLEAYHRLLESGAMGGVDMDYIAKDQP